MGPSYLFCLVTFLAQYEHSLWVQAFGVPTSGSPSMTSRTLLHLKPQQGSELVQASEHLYGPHDDDDDDDGNAESRPPAHPVVEKQRSFVRRAFSLPSYLWHPHAKAEGVRMYHTNKNDHHAVNHPNEKIATKHHPDTKKNDFVQEVFHDVHELHKYEDVVYFPIIGFTFVKDAPGHSRPLPGLTNPSCRLHDDNEVYYGSFHPDPTRRAQENNGDLSTPNDESSTLP